MEIGSDTSPSSNQPPRYRRCKRKYREIIRERVEDTVEVAWTFRKSQAEAPTTPKPASNATDSLLKVKEEKKTTDEPDLRLKKQTIQVNQPLRYCIQQNKVIASQSSSML